MSMKVSKFTHNFVLMVDVWNKAMHIQNEKYCYNRFLTAIRIPVEIKDLQLPQFS